MSANSAPYVSSNILAALLQPSAAKIEMISGEPELATRDPNGNRSYNEAHWTFDANGPILLDLSVIDSTLKGLLPQRR